MGKRRHAVRAYAKEKNFNRGGGKVGEEPYDLTKRDNALFAKYYQGLGIVPADEWDEFYAKLKETLPVTFRVTGYKKQAEELLSMVKGKFFKSFLDAKFEGEPVAPPRCISWYPDELAWQLDLTRKIMRSNEEFSRLHDFLVAATECGAVSRQEAVSMIPPLVLDVKSHHKVLDMCAAPGSKTAQIIEYLHGTCPPGELPSGYVIANDADNKRCYLMVHQVKRLQSPSFMIVNHDGTVFPKIRINTDDNNPQYQMFDRVLCDVPCSGDGTMRKNFDVWTKWHPLQGANLHGLQSKILKRGCQLLTVGGRLVYSTCSLNPVEDEAIIAEMLRQSDGAMELVDIEDALPGLKFTKGISSWKVMTKTGEWISDPEELPPGLKTQYKITIFPPTQEEADKFHLDKCMRILPHQQNTGGFFIAALRKVRHLPGSREANIEAAKEAAKEKALSQASESASASGDGEGVAVSEPEKRKADFVNDGPKPKKQRLWGYKEDPFLFMKADNPTWACLRKFFGIDEKLQAGQIMYRSEKGQRNLYFVSEAIRQIAECNNDKIKMVNMGVKAFSRSPSVLVPDCDFRISQESLGSFLPFLSQRIVNVTKKDAITMLSEENPYSDKLTDKTQKQFNAMSIGSSVFVYNPSEEDTSPNCQIVFCGWRGKTSVRFFGSRCDRAHYLSLFGEDLKEINKRVEAKKKEKEMAKKKVDCDEGLVEGNENISDAEIKDEEQKDSEDGPAVMEQNDIEDGPAEEACEKTETMPETDNDTNKEETMGSTENTDKGDDDSVVAGVNTESDHTEVEIKP